MEVYEENLLFCLKSKDFVNFDHCQNILLSLYADSPVPSKKQDQILFLIGLSAVFEGANHFERLLARLVPFGLSPFDDSRRLWSIWRNMKTGNYPGVFDHFERETDQFALVIIERQLELLRTVSMERIASGFHGKLLPTKEFQRLFWSKKLKANSDDLKEFLQRKSKPIES